MTPTPGRRAPAEGRFTPVRRPVPVHPDLASPNSSTQAWRTRIGDPWYIDYLYLGLTNSLAFSPTDVTPMSKWLG